MQEMQSHVAKLAPLEACGLLAGNSGHVEHVIKIRNQMQSPARFVMDPREQLMAFDWIDSEGLELVGIFHSHPAGPETVSVTDIAEVTYDVVHIIWSRNGDVWKARGFWIEDGKAGDVTLEITD